MKTIKTTLKNQIENISTKALKRWPDNCIAYFHQVPVPEILKDSADNKLNEKNDIQ